MINSSNRHPRRPLVSTLAIGVPWLAVVGLLAGAEYVRNEGTLTRGLLQLFSANCPGQVAGLELPECVELEAPRPEFPFESKPDWFVFATGRLEALENVPPVAQLHVTPSPPAVRLGQSSESLLAVEAAKAEVEHAVAAARASLHEAQQFRASSTFLLRRHENSRSDDRGAQVSLRVSTDG